MSTPYPPVEIPPQENCRFAMTTKTVACSHISAEPLFYSKNPTKSKLESEVEKFVKMRKSLSGKQNNAEEVCCRMFRQPIGEEQTNELYRHTTSKTLNTYLTWASLVGVEVKRGPVNSPHYVRETKTVTIPKVNSFLNDVVSVVRGLRTAWLWEEKRRGNESRKMHPDFGILVNRLFEADINLLQAKVLIELKDGGSESAKEFVTTHNYWRELVTIASEPEPFISWILSPIVNRVDINVIRAWLGNYQLFREQTAPNVGSIISDVFSGPFGNNHMGKKLNTSHIVSDPLFAEARSRSNANFVWFIKFEAECRQAEQEVPTEEVEEVDNVVSLTDYRELRNKT